MSSLNLLNINVDTLFKQHSVTEIDEIHKKVQEVIENKKEELRTMVGERYRDLLTAADTITRMQQSTKTLITEVESISGYCKNLNDQQLLGFKTDEDTVSNLRKHNANKQMTNYFATMVQIKLLTCLPELIWSHLDRQQFYGATELFLFSRHISTGLQLNTDNALMEKLPVAKKQWEIIRPFHQTIKQRVLLALENDRLTVDLMVDCLMALLQLDRTSLENVLKCFLNLRCTAFSNCLASDTHGRIKERILTSLEVLYNSLDLIHHCFLDEKGVFFVKLKEQSDSTVLPTITRMPKDDAQFIHLLPDIIIQFKPKFDAITLNSEAIQLALDEWLLSIVKLADNQLKQLFDLVTHMNVIQEIKMAANNLLKELNLQELKLLNSLNFYELHYVPLINQRVRDIIHDSWSSAINHTFHVIQNIITLQEYRKSQQLSNMWEENLSDLPQSLATALNNDLKVKNLLMRLKGYDEQIITICTEFDDKLSLIINEMSVLMEEQLTKREEKQKLVDFLRETARNQLTQFLTKLNTLQLTTTTITTGCEVDKQAILFLVHCCCALIELSPHLKICFCQQKSWRQFLPNPSTSTSDEYWHEICTLMEDQIYQLWLRIIDNILDEYACKHYMPVDLKDHVVLEDFALWDSITVEQKDENDQSIQTVFRLPKQPRISLQMFLHIIITQLGITVPQTLPTRILNVFNEKLLQKLLEYYECVLEKQEPTQNMALQMYFDLKFLQNLFKLTKPELREQFNMLQSKYRNFIDPFDFELLASHILNNVKRIVQRLTGLYGVLVPLREQTVPTANTTSSTSGLLQENEPNVLSLCSNSSTTVWFPLLPIVSNTATASVSNSTLSSSANDNQANAFNKTTKDTEKVTHPRKPGASGTRKGDSKSKSVATSFFGSMSQEWFR